MKIYYIIKSLFFLIISVIVTNILISCGAGSECFRDKSAGINGSFEIVREGLPVNWLVYSPKTIPNSDFDIIIDTKEFKEGKQSLKFLVKKCSKIGGKLSPGIANEFKANAGDKYKISFWIKNIGTEFSFRIGAVTALNGVEGPVLKTKDTLMNWKFFEYEYTIPEKMERLRVEMNILSPGIFWIDDIRIINSRTNQAPEQI